jgi:hypothetical protein
MPRFIDLVDSDGTPFNGGPTQNPAFERSNNGNVPLDGTAIVPLEPGPEDSFVFDYPASTGGGGGGSITITDGSITFNNTTIIEFPIGTITPLGPGVVQYIPEGEHDINAWKQAGEWYTANNSGGINPIFSMNAGLLYAIPVIVTRGRTVSALSLWVDSGNSGALVHMALYDIANAGNILPRAPIAIAAGLDASGSGVRVQGAINQAVNPGHYWIVATATVSLGIFGLIGQVPTLPTTGDPPTQKKWLVNDTGIFGNGNPFSMGDAAASDGPYFAWKM